MFKRTKKKVSVLIVMAMVFTMLLGAIAPAAASSPLTGTVIGTIPTVVNAGSAELANVRYAEVAATAGNIISGQIEITLPSGVHFRGGLNQADFVLPSPGLTVTMVGGAPAANTRTVTYDVYRTSAINAPETLVFKFPVHASVVSSGDIVANVAVQGNINIADGQYVVGRFGTGDIAVSLWSATIPTVSRFETGVQTLDRTIRFRENAAGAFAASPANRLVLTLPSGVTWDAYYATERSNGALHMQRDAANARRLNVWVYPASTGITGTTYGIVGPRLNLSRIAPLGDIEVSIIGEGANADVNTSLVIAKTAEFDVTVRRQENVNPRTVTAGREDQTLAAIEIVEATAASLINGGTIVVNAPVGMRFSDDSSQLPTATVSRGNVGVPAAFTVSKDQKSASITVGTASSLASTIRIAFPQSALIGPRVSGELTLTVGGTAGASGGVVVANVNPVATVTADSVTRMRINAVEQVAGDVLITEAAQGRLLDGREIHVTITNPFVTFNKIPTVSVVEGNLTIGTPRMTNYNTLIIPVTSRSTRASVIKIGNIVYDVERGYWAGDEGNISLRVTGPSFVDTNVDTWLRDRGERVSVANASAGAPEVSVFTIGSMTYTVDGRSIEMDVAPVIKNGRTLLPLRFTASATGVNDEEIMWDSVRKTVTLIRGDRVVQVTIGSTTMLINGAAITMDVAPEIINGRTMLPIRWIGTALRANIDWDETAKTVTVRPF